MTVHAEPFRVVAPQHVPAELTLEQRGLTLPDADAERREPVAAAAAAELVQQ